MRSRPIAFLLVAAAVLGPSCGGSSNETLKGVFVDSPVGGLRYSSGGHSGTTDAGGRFTYAAGDTITFSIGDTNLPTIPAGPILSPMTLFGTSDLLDARVVNLCRLLQTLDTDANPANGITIAAAAHAAATGQPVIDFASGTFDTDATIVNLLANGGGAASLVSGAQATAHLQSQTIVGSWYVLLAPGVHSSAVITFLSDGTYMMAEDGNPATDPSGMDGMERGLWAWNTVTHAFAAATQVDTSGQWGLSHPNGGPITVTINVDTLSMSDSNGITNLTRMNPSASNALVGSWKHMLPPGGHSSVVVTFFASGDYMMAEDGNPNVDPSGNDGMERGTYTWNSGTGAFTATATVDTNGQWGFSGNISNVTVVGNALHENGVPTGFTRVIP